MQNETNIYYFLLPIFNPFRLQNNYYLGLVGVEARESLLGTRMV